MTHLETLETRAVDFLRSIASQRTDICLAYSGGKDSEVLLHLARKSKIPFTAYFNNTTIDPPGTLSWIRSKGNITINQPRRSFFTLIEHRGLPSTFQRFCCDKLKERYISDTVLVGIRRDESKRRADKYKEPEQCMTLHSGRKVRNYMPILYWTLQDLTEYIHAESIQCHPAYYNPDGTFNPKCRLGCLGCPLPYDRGLKDFVRYPKLVRAWCRALAVYRSTRPVLGTSVTNFRDEYENFLCNVFFRTYQKFDEARQQWPRHYAWTFLMNYFGHDLPSPHSPIEVLTKRIPIKPSPLLPVTALGSMQVH